MIYKLYIEYYYVGGSSKVIQGMTGTKTKFFATIGLLDFYLTTRVYCPKSKRHHILHYEISEILHKE